MLRAISLQMPWIIPVSMPLGALGQFWELAIHPVKMSKQGVKSSPTRRRKPGRDGDGEGKDGSPEYEPSAPVEPTGKVILPSLQ